MKSRKGWPLKREDGLERRRIFFEDWRKNSIFVIDGNCPVGRERQMPGREGRLEPVEGVGCRAHSKGLARTRGSTQGIDGGRREGRMWGHRGRQAGKRIRRLASDAFCFLSEIRKRDIF